MQIKPWVVQEVERPRPLIYIYELPTEYNTGMLEQRIKKVKCVVRYYDDKNWTRWENNLYGAELVVYEQLMRSKHRTTNGASVAPKVAFSESTRYKHQIQCTM